MRRAGVRELRQRASDLLRRVERGETIEITDHGRPVALLTPIPDDDLDPYERMVAVGDIEPATGSIDDLPPPMPSTGPESPSVVLARLRADER